MRPLAADMGHGEWRATHLVVVKVRGAARREVVADGPSQVRDESRDVGHLTGENDVVRLPAEQPPLGLFGPAPVEVHGAQLRSRGRRRVLLDVDADQRDLLLVAVGDVDARRPVRGEEAELAAAGTELQDGAAANQAPAVSAEYTLQHVRPDGVAPAHRPAEARLANALVALPFVLHRRLVVVGEDVEHWRGATKGFAAKPRPRRRQEGASMFESINKVCET